MKTEPYLADEVYGYRKPLNLWLRYVAGTELEPFLSEKELLDYLFKLAMIEVISIRGEIRWRHRRPAFRDHDIEQVLWARVFGLKKCFI